MKMGVERRWMGKGREREGESAALNTHSSTRPTGTLFPCKFCLHSLPLPPLPSVSSSSSFTLSHVKAERRTCAYPVCTMHTSLPFRPSRAVDLHYPSFRVDSITFAYSIDLTKTNFPVLVNDPSRLGSSPIRLSRFFLTSRRVLWPPPARTSFSTPFLSFYLRNLFSKIPKLFTNKTIVSAS